MNKFVLILISLLSALPLAAQVYKAAETISSGIQVIDGNEERQAQRRTRVVFWTNTVSQGPIKVYLNGRYAGTITKAYSSTPRCGAYGCVTVEVGGMNNKWYGVSSDGKRWTGHKGLVAGHCNAVRLYSTGTRSDASGAGASSDLSASGRAASGSSSSSSWYKDSEVQQIVRETGGAIGTAVGMGLSAVSDTSWGKYRNRLDAGVGYGASYGDLGVKFGYRAPAAFGITAGIGLDPCKREGSDEKMGWNVSLQLWPTNGWNFEVGVGPRYFKKYEDRQIGVVIMTNYEHQIYRRLGVTGGVGCSLSTKTPEGFEKSDMAVNFEWNIGLVIRLFAD